MGFSGGISGKEPSYPGDTGDSGSILSQENPLEKEMATHSSILAWRIPWTEAGYSPWGRKESAGLRDFCFLSFLLAGRFFTSEPQGKL